MKLLEPPNSHHLSAAVGWLELGNYLEANEELDKITPGLRAHPYVLEVRSAIYSKAERWDVAWEVGKTLITWTGAKADHWIAAAYAARRTPKGGLKSAYDTLLPAAEKYPDEPIVLFNLACYDCQMGNLAEAKGWLEKSFAIGPAKKLKLMALEEPDLEPLWKEIGEL